MKTISPTHLSLATNISDQFKLLPEVESIAIGCSQTVGGVDENSDIDLYIYTSKSIHPSIRKKIVNLLGARRADLNLTFWDDGDEWIDLETEIEVDLIYWDKNWITEQIDRVLIQHQANMGYSTCFWHTVLNSIILFDRNAWFRALQEKCRQSYPDNLKKAIIANNHPILRNVIPSYYFQIKKAIERKDQISINHRIAAMLASYFDVLFAINYITNPGEKKMLDYALKYCSKIPEKLTKQIENLLQSASSNHQVLRKNIDNFLDGLDELLLQEGIDPSKTIELNG